MDQTVSLSPDPTEVKTPASEAPSGVFEELQAALAVYQETPENGEAAERLHRAQSSVATLLAKLPKREPQHAYVARGLEAVRTLSSSGIYDYAICAEWRARYSEPKQLNNWPDLLSAMVLGAAWQWGDVPSFDRLPQWLWGDYAAWLFTAPQGFTAVGDADRYASFVEERLGELVRLVERNTGSTAVRAAGDAYLVRASGIPLYFSKGSLRRIAELRGRLLKRLVGREPTRFEPLPFPRAGRLLRIGFLNRHFGPQTETYTTIPTFEHLDPERFEVILFALRPADNPLAEYCQGRAKEYHVLPDSVEQQLSMLRDANLDVLVFGTNLTAVAHELTRLALYRIAPLQVVNNSSCITTGSPEIDLYVSGDLTECADAPQHFTERLALLPGPAHAFNYDADRQEPTVRWTRESLGLPADSVVFVTAANYYKIIPEMQHAWARLLSAVPNSRLLVHPFNPNWSSSYPIKRFCAEFDRVLGEHGISRDRLIVSTERFPSRTDVRELLSVGDIYLDTFPFGGVNSLVDPLEAGMPVVVWEGESFRSRMGAALVRVLDMPELIAATEGEYLRIASELAQDASRRAELSARIRHAMERTPVFLDTLAASDAFGDLIEVAYDELSERGREPFHQERTPLRAVSPALSDPFGEELDAARAELRRNPAGPAARHKMGKALLAIGNSKRASEYLLAAVQSDERNPQLWMDLATTFRQMGQLQHAVQALEGSLRAEPRNAEALAMLVQIAEHLGAHDMAQEAQAMLDELNGMAPPQVAQMER